MVTCISSACGKAELAQQIHGFVGVMTWDEAELKKVVDLKLFFKHIT